MSVKLGTVVKDSISDYQGLAQAKRQMSCIKVILDPPRQGDPPGTAYWFVEDQLQEVPPPPSA